MKNIIFLISIIIANAFGMEGGYGFSSPIYFFPGNKLSQAHLSVSIPSNFKEIPGSSDHFKGFVRYDSPNQGIWSEKIYTHFVLQGNCLNELFNLRTMIFKNCPIAKVKYVSIEDMITHTIATMIFSYSGDNQDIVVFARYISGLNCCAGYQHYINATKQDQRQAIKALKEFAVYNTELKNFGGQKNDSIS